jgi:hypothetical protein
LRFYRRDIWYVPPTLLFQPPAIRFCSLTAWLGLHEREIVLANFLEPLIWGEIAAARYAIAVFFALPLLSSLLGVVLGFASLSFLLQVALGFPFLFSFLQYQTG